MRQFCEHIGYSKNDEIYVYPQNRLDALELMSPHTQSLYFVRVTSVVFVRIWAFDLKDLTSSAAYQQRVALLSKHDTRT